MSQITIAFLLFPNVTQLDLTGPAQVLSRLGSARVHLVAKTLEPVATDCGFCLVPTAMLVDVTKADILCIPGGAGTVSIMEDEAILSWVRDVAQSAQWVTSVCTGSLVLAAAGLLEGYRATCHWTAREQLRWFGAIPVAERVIFDRNRVTGAGVTAGIDFALALTARIRGDEHAKLVQLGLEYDPAPPFGCGTPDAAEPQVLQRFNEMGATSLEDRAKHVEFIARTGFPRRPERNRL